MKLNVLLIGMGKRQSGGGAEDARRWRTEPWTEEKNVRKDNLDCLRGSRVAREGCFVGENDIGRRREVKGSHNWYPKELAHKG